MQGEKKTVISGSLTIDVENGILHVAKPVELVEQDGSVRMAVDTSGIALDALYDLRGRFQGHSQITNRMELGYDFNPFAEIEGILVDIFGGCLLSYRALGL